MNYQIQSVACDDCENPSNEAWSPPLNFKVTSLPPKPANLKIVEESISDLERANVIVGWENPNIDYDSGKSFFNFSFFFLKGSCFLFKNLCIMVL